MKKLTPSSAFYLICFIAVALSINADCFPKSPPPPPKPTGQITALSASPSPVCIRNLQGFTTVFFNVTSSSTQSVFLRVNGNAIPVPVGLNAIPTGINNWSGQYDLNLNEIFPTGIPQSFKVRATLQTNSSSIADNLIMDTVSITITTDRNCPPPGLIGN